MVYGKKDEAILSYDNSPTSFCFTVAWKNKIFSPAKVQVHKLHISMTDKTAKKENFLTLNRKLEEF